MVATPFVGLVTVNFHESLVFSLTDLTIDSGPSMFTKSPLLEFEH